MKTPILIAMALLAAAPEPARADMWSNLGNALHDLHTFGQFGRTRRRMQLEAEATAMAEKRKAAEAEKAQRMNHLGEQNRMLETMQGDLQFINLVLNEVSIQFADLTSYLQKNVAGRTWLGGAFRRWRGVSAADQSFINEVLNTLEAASSVAPAAEGEDLAQRREALLRSKEAIDRLRATARSQGMEMNEMLGKVIGLLETTQAEEALAKIVLAGQNLEKLKAYVVARAAGIAQERARKKAETDTLNAQPLPPPPAPLPPMEEAPPARDPLERCGSLCT